MKRLFLAGAIAGLSSACAYAADLGPYRAPPPPERDYYEPVRDMPWSWRGFYAGVNAGYAWGGDDSVTLSGPGGTATGTLEPNGWFGGGQIGYNAQFQSLVFGIEADLQGADISDGNAFASTNVDWFSTVRGRVGYAAGPALLYATGGFAFADVNTTRYCERRLLQQRRGEDGLCARWRHRVGIRAELVAQVGISLRQPRRRRF